MLQWARTIWQEHPYQKLARTVTQFVVGAVGDTDQELLSLSDRLYRTLGLARAYYSAFHPVEQTPFENITPTDPLREHRLYQASFLLRDYGWSIEDLSFLEDGNLRIDIDPKRAWAERNLRETPIDVMNATRRQLLRVPGIGPIVADAIILARRLGGLTDLAHLPKLHIHAPEQAAPYILLAAVSAEVCVKAATEKKGFASSIKTLAVPLRIKSDEKQTSTHLLLLPLRQSQG